MPPKSFLFGGQLPAARSDPSRVGAGRRSWTGANNAAAPAAAAAFLGSGRAAVAPKAKPAKAPLPRVPRGLPDTPLTPPEGYVGDSIDDALDDLLRQAAASLKHLDGLRGKLPAAPRHDAARSRKSDADSFWKPRCRADLWGDDDDLWEGLGSDLDSDLDSDDDASSAGIEVEEDDLWGFLRAAYGAEAAGPGQKSSARKAPGSTSRTSANARSQPPRPQRTNHEAPPRHEEKSSQGPSERARAHGFQFGSYGSAASAGGAGRPPLPGAAFGAPAPEVQKPEVQISAVLNKAKAEGPDAVRTTLKKLLLKWHPDKAPQGDGPEDVAARTEATRVLRHVLQERKRLGI